MPCLMRTSALSSSASSVRDSDWNSDTPRVSPRGDSASLLSASFLSGPVRSDSTLVRSSSISTHTPSSARTSNPSSAARFSRSETRFRAARGVSGVSTTERKPSSTASRSAASRPSASPSRTSAPNTLGVSVSTSRSATFRCELPSVVYSARDTRRVSSRVSSASARRGGGVAARFSAQNRTQRPYASEAKSSAALVRTTTGVSWRASNPSRHMESAMACACSRLTPVCSRFVPSGTTSLQRTRRTRGESAYAASRRFSSSTVARAASRPSRAGARGVSRDAMTGAPRLGARRPELDRGPAP